MNRSIFLLGIFFLFPICLALAEPEVQEEYQYYSIRGKSAEELNRIMRDQGLGTEKWEKFSAYCRWNVQWHYKYNRGAGSCSIRAVTTKVRILYYMPKWMNPMGVDLVTRLGWDAFIKALETHEKGHGAHGIEAAREIEATLLGLPPQKTCGELSFLCEEAAKDIVSKHRRADAKYDEDTLHGYKQGVVFLDIR